MRISEFQQLMKKMYFHRDSKRGTALTFVWIIEELGEFSRALRHGDRKALEDEAADLLAWICSECNLLDIDLERATLAKYGNKCPRCGKIPCECAFI